MRNWTQSRTGVRYVRPVRRPAGVNETKGRRSNETKDELDEKIGRWVREVMEQHPSRPDLENQITRLITGGKSEKR